MKFSCIETTLLRLQHDQYFSPSSRVQRGERRRDSGILPHLVISQFSRKGGKPSYARPNKISFFSSLPLSPFLLQFHKKGRELDDWKMAAGGKMVERTLLPLQDIIVFRRGERRRGRRRRYCLVEKGKEEEDDSEILGLMQGRWKMEEEGYGHHQNR